MTPGEIIDLRYQMDRVEEEIRERRKPELATSQGVLRARCVELWQAEREQPHNKALLLMLDVRHRRAEAGYQVLAAAIEHEVASARCTTAERIMGPSAFPT